MTITYAQAHDLLEGLVRARMGYWAPSVAEVERARVKAAEAEIPPEMVRALLELPGATARRTSRSRWRPRGSPSRSASACPMTRASCASTTRSTRWAPAEWPAEVPYGDRCGVRRRGDSSGQGSSGRVTGNSLRPSAGLAQRSDARPSPGTSPPGPASRPARARDTRQRPESPRRRSP